jgi:quinol monooxygenase YgiN
MRSEFMFFEDLKSMGDLEKHRETPQLKAYRREAGNLPAKPVEVTLFETICEA